MSYSPSGTADLTGIFKASYLTQFKVLDFRVLGFECLKVSGLKVLKVSGFKGFKVWVLGLGFALFRVVRV